MTESIVQYFGIRKNFLPRTVIINYYKSRFPPISSKISEVAKSMKLMVRTVH